MKLLLSVLFISVVCTSAFCSGYDSDTLYFCREYKNAKEIGNSNTFSIGLGGDSITVMVKTKAPINEKSVSIVVERIDGSEYINAGTHKFDVEPAWDYIFFAGINFWTEGNYRVSLQRKDGTIIAQNTVSMVLTFQR